MYCFEVNIVFFIYNKFNCITRNFRFVLYAVRLRVKKTHSDDEDDSCLMFSKRKIILGLISGYFCTLHRKIKLFDIPVPSRDGMSLTKVSLGGNHEIIYFIHVQWYRYMFI